MAEEGKVNTHLLCDIPRDEGKGGRYAGTGWPWPRGESRGKSGFHGNRNPHLEDDLVVRRIDLFNHLAAVIEWCMPTIHHFFIQRKYRSTKASTDRGWMYKFSPRLRVEEKVYSNYLIKFGSQLRDAPTVVSTIFQDLIIFQRLRKQRNNSR